MSASTPEAPLDGVDSIAVRRKRREKKKSGASSALEKIKRSRETGLHEETELEEHKGLFDYVEEDEYARIVQQRQEEGFILDDDGTYCEHGREIFDEEAETASKDKKTKVKKPGMPKRVAKPTSNIKHMLLSKAGSSGNKKKKQESVSLDNDELLNDLLQQAVKEPRRPHPSATPTHTNPRSNSFTPRLSSTPQAPRPHTAKKIRVTKSHDQPTTTTSVAKRFSKSADVSSFPKPQPPLKDESGVYEDTAGGDDFGMDWGGCDDDNWEDGDAGEGVRGGGDSDGVRPHSTADDGWAMAVKEEEQKEEPMMEEEKTVVPEAAVSVSGWETVRDELEETKNVFGGIQVDSSSLPTRQLDGEEVLPFFWLDAYEDTFHQPGTVYLIGKVWVEQAKAYVSCCVVVKNIERCLYFLPREKKLKGGKETDEEVTFEDVYREFSSKFADPYNIVRFTSKRVLKHYAFELPDVPSESEYLEVRYSHDYPAPPSDSKGNMFSRVFGTNTSSLERLILKCGLKGPSWLHIKQPSCPQQPISWCKCEAIVQSMSCISVVAEQPPPPPLVVMSLSVKIILNPKTGTNEVLCLGSLVHPDIHFDKPPPKHPFKADLLAIRRPVDRDFPFRFEEYVRKKGYNVEVSPSERAMLAYFLAKLHRVDPDIIVGHNMGSFALEVLQHRMAACKVPQWSRIGRLRRKELPRGRMAGHWLCAGRPICDVRISAKELIRAKSYDLAELANTVLHRKHTVLDHEDILRAFCSCEHLSGVVAHTMDESMLSLQLMYELNVLPLAYQITCIAGNVFSRTLMGGRAERNEFLLLHAFTAKDYICPDKHFQGKKTHHQHTEVDLGEGGDEQPQQGAATSSGHGRRKPAYSGGLVLEPKRGFYDRFILLLDFNSLYPSIMQEYNICFTTIDHAHCPTDEEGGYSKLELPDLATPMGILPSEIRVLVERRRQVKQLMKGAQSNPELYMQYDIRQKALKLTANSMYGCLGFANSRFYAKPLAALITGKGREILCHTKELAQKLGLDVIYGDTDSIMIDSNTRVLEEAEKIAQKVKVEVNKLYRLLEIDIDGIFKSMLLLRKKKYAAVSIEKRDGKFIENRELKGLDIVRRDWCELAKKSGHYVLDQILSGAPLDNVIEKVQEYLQKLQKNIHDGKVELSLFVITKSLTKPPSDYPDKKALPHVQVALRMQSRNQHIQPGDVIPYIMCKGDSHQSAALRAFHPDEVTKQTHLEVDTLYYLQHQVHAVVSRLCEPIEGLDAACIAQCLGLDASNYRSSSAGQEDGEGTDGGLFGSHGEKKGTFEDVDPLLVTCHSCQKVVRVQGSQCTNKSKGLNCPECDAPFPTGRITNQLTLSIRAHIKRYYAGWLVCEDQSCQFHTRNPTVCLEDSAPKCRNCLQGKLREEYPSSALYRQLVSFDVLFTIKEGDNHDDRSRDKYKRLRTHLSKYLDQNQYSKVNLGRLFPVFST